jgi:hypothetical protein
MALGARRPAVMVVLSIASVAAFTFFAARFATGSWAF